MALSSAAVSVCNWFHKIDLIMIVQTVTSPDDPAGNGNQAIPKTMGGLGPAGLGNRLILL